MVAPALVSTWIFGWRSWVQIQAALLDLPAMESALVELWVPSVDHRPSNQSRDHTSLSMNAGTQAGANQTALSSRAPGLGLSPLATEEPGLSQTVEHGGPPGSEVEEDGHAAEIQVLGSQLPC